MAIGAPCISIVRRFDYLELIPQYLSNLEELRQAHEIRLKITYKKLRERLYFSQNPVGCQSAEPILRHRAFEGTLVMTI